MCYSRIPARSSTWCRPWQRDGGITGHLQLGLLLLLKTGGGDAPAPSRLCFAWDEGVKSEAVRAFPLSSKPCKPQMPCPHNPALHVGTFVSVGFRPFPSRASEGRGLVPAESSSPHSLPTGRVLVWQPGWGQSSLSRLALCPS